MPTSFQDAESRNWDVVIDIDAVERVETLTKIDLTVPEAGGDLPLYARLTQSMLTLYRVLWALVKPQADKRGVKREQFIDAVKGPALADAESALWQEWENFFRSRGSDAKAMMLEKTRAITLELVSEATKKIQELDPAKAVSDSLTS